ncbi:hypothetical protein AM1_A0158 (plasmid) [Acaryochloris marina MBIC11017]|uniref:Uncharacterized protein n=1 Tax=Acaryochloris marina (strain MBIC 11017) TaxID=329726 RepID=A8ZKG5_ACAM1|nr:hypothetical protein AM1_A0158 [Acaryochloris marina MBIC11017]
MTLLSLEPLSDIGCKNLSNSKRVAQTFWKLNRINHIHYSSDPAGDEKDPAGN